MRISDWSSDVCSSDLLELASPEHFFALPQAARLAVLRSLVTDPRAVAELVTYVLDQPLSERVVSENELSDLLLDYLRNSEFRRNYELSGAHGGQWYTEEPLKCLWELLPRLGAAPHEGPHRIEAPLMAMVEHLPALPRDRLGPFIIELDESDRKSTRLNSSH